MAITITGAEVMNRLNITTNDVSATIMSQLILVADAWETQVLAQNSVSSDSLTSAQTAILKAAKIAFTAKMAVTSAPAATDDFSVGPIKIKAISSKEKKELSDVLQEEITMLLNVNNWVEVAPYTSSSGGDDYVPDGEDITNIDFGETEDYPFSTLG